MTGCRWSMATAPRDAVAGALPHAGDGRRAPTPLTEIPGSSPAASSRPGGCGSPTAVALGYTRVVTHDSARFADGRFAPGDVFRRCPDGEGWLFAGRSDQLVKVFGRWVDVVAVEQAVQGTHARQGRGGVRDPGAGRDADMIRLHLFAIPGDLPPPQVLAAAQAAIEPAALPAPEKIHLVDHFPRTDTGKLRRNELARAAPAETRPVERGPGPIGTGPLAAQSSARLDAVDLVLHRLLTVGARARRIEVVMRGAPSHGRPRGSLDRGHHLVPLAPSILVP